MVKKGVRMLTREDLARELKVHPNTVDNWRKQGLPCVKINKSVRFDLQDVIDWLKENSEE